MSQKNFKTLSTTQQNVSSLSPNSEYYEDSKCKQSKGSVKSLKKRSIGSSSNSVKDDLQGQLEQIEQYQLRSSEDISEEIENLTSCVTSNRGALEKSLDDMLVQTSGKKDRKEVEEVANRIIS